MEDSENVGKSLFLVCSQRIYRPDEAPEKVRERACAFEAEHLEPEILTDRMVCGIEDELVQHGLVIRTSGRDSHGPFWTLDCQGAGVGIALRCEELAKYVAARKFPHDAGLLARIIDSGNGPELTSEAGGRDGCRTVSDGEYCLDDPAEIALAQAICADWADYVAGLARRMHRDLEKDRDYLCSWEAVRDSLISNDCGITADGRPVALSEGRTEGSGYNVGD